MYQYPIFETIAILNGKPQNLEYHQVRMNKAVEFLFKNANSLNLAEIIQIPKEYQTGLVRCRIDYNQQDYKTLFAPYQKREIKSYQCVYLDNIDYQFKYSNRSDFEKINIDNDEAIIIQNNKVTDCRIGNLLFLKENIWYSPKDYLLKGTQLSYLLAQNKIVLKEINVNEIHQYEKIMMINAMNPFDESRAIPTQQIAL
nr:aminotransferase class IV family protein [uncultured Haemophilus sp.]